MFKLYGYWRSSASYRVRIALNLKGLDYETIPVHLVKDGGEQHSEEYRLLNPAELVPTLVDDDLEQDISLNQSLAIIEYLDERFPETSLVPSHKVQRAKVRAVAYDIACETQPIANLRVLQYLQSDMKVTDEQKTQWAKHWIEQGLKSVEQRIQHSAGKYCFGFEVTLADVCLIPQLYNAKRFGVDLEQYPVISRVYANCEELEAFQKALPENQPDAT